MTPPKCFKLDPEKLMREAALFESIVGAGAIERMRVQTELEPFLCDLIVAVHKYHATLKSREYGRLMRSNAQYRARESALRKYLGEDNYLAILSFLDARR